MYWSTLREHRILSSSTDNETLDIVTVAHGEVTLYSSREDKDTVTLKITSSELPG